jgi:hypothetical protein
LIEYVINLNCTLPTLFKKSLCLYCCTQLLNTWTLVVTMKLIYFFQTKKIQRSQKLKFRSPQVRMFKENSSYCSRAFQFKLFIIQWTFLLIVTILSYLFIGDLIQGRQSGHLFMTSHDRLRQLRRCFQIQVDLVICER